MCNVTSFFQNSTFLRQQGYLLVEIWECSFRDLKKRTRSLQDFITDGAPNFFCKHKGQLTACKNCTSNYKQSRLPRITRTRNIRIPNKFKDFVTIIMEPDNGGYKHTCEDCGQECANR